MSRLFTINHLLFLVLDLLFPPKCAICQKEGERWCIDCAKISEFISIELCKICGNPGNKGTVCRDCVSNPPSFTAARAWGLHQGDLRKVVHQLKYLRNIALGEVVSKELAKLVINEGWDIDMVIPIPLSKKRNWVRGYNQAELLGYPLAWKLGLDYSTKILYRSRETKTQIGLNREERKENVRNAFDLKSKKVKEKTILLIDDVITTGATMNSASEALIAAGAKKVYALSISRATGLMKI